MLECCALAGSKQTLERKGLLRNRGCEGITRVKVRVASPTPSRWRRAAAATEEKVGWLFLERVCRGAKLVLVNECEWFSGRWVTGRSFVSRSRGERQLFLEEQWAQVSCCLRDSGPGLEP